MSEPWTELMDLCAEGSSDSICRFLDGLPANEVALAVSRLSDDERTRLATLLEPKESADLLEKLPAIQAVQVIENLEPGAAAAIIDQMPSNEQADLLGDLSEPDAVEILSRMDPEEAADAEALRQYDTDVAGGLMVTEFLKYPERFTVKEAVDDMRQRSDDYRDYDVQYAYVTDRRRRLTGVLRLRDLLLARPSETLASLMIKSPVSVNDQTPVDGLVDLFQRHDYLGVPVIDENGRILGVVRRDAVSEAQGDQHDSDYLKTQGIVGGEEIRTMPLLLRSRRRLGWLSVNILLNVMAASVIAFFQETLSAVIALAVFLPIISDMSGCSGNQAVAVSMRELSLGLVRPHEFFRVLWKEAAVGVLNGAALGALIAGVAFAWQGNYYLGLVVGLALCLNTLLAVSLGGVVPLIVRRLGMDPAIASGPILTTVTDMCGFLLVLGLATVFLAQLTT